MAINQRQLLSMQQKLSPQQIQMIKLLELPTMQLEQRIKQEIEENIVLEEDRHTFRVPISWGETKSVASLIEKRLPKPVYCSGGVSIWVSEPAGRGFTPARYRAFV